MRLKIAPAFSSLLCWAMLTGCAGFLRPAGDSLLPGHPEAQVPDRWSALAASTPEAATGWLEDLAAPKLKQLVDQAMEANENLREAAARMQSAQARARIAGADLFPNLNGDLDMARSERLRGANFQKTLSNQYGLGIATSWELDLWGRLANRRQSAAREFHASAADLQAARLSLAADVARSAIQLLAAQRQISLTQGNLKSLEANLAILNANHEAGVAEDRMGLDIALARADVARSKATLQANLRTVDSARRRLEILIGNYPKGALQGLTEFPETTRAIPAGLPSELLLRRPDLIAAELRADAALDEIAATRKALLPSLRLNGSVGTSTTEDFDLLIDERALIWNIAGTLTQQIFQGGRLRATIDEAKAQADIVAARYAQIALQAFSEVEVALAAEQFLIDQQSQLRIAADEADRAAELAISRYENGLVEILTVLDSQRRAFEFRSSLLEITSQRLQNRIDLYLALGGDFDSVPVSVATPESP